MDNKAGLNGAANHSERIEPEPELIDSVAPSSTVFDIDDLATEEDDAEITGENVLARTEVRAPHAQEWFRVHPKWGLSTRAVIDRRGTKPIVYLLHKRLMPWSETLEQDSVSVSVRACINLKGKIFVWVVRKSKDDGALSSNYSTALEHIQKATTDWIRRFWLDDEKRHVMRVAKISDKPAWPEGVGFQDVMIAGFGSRIISDENAPILRELRGENADA